MLLIQEPISAKKNPRSQTLQQQNKQRKQKRNSVDIGLISDDNRKSSVDFPKNSVFRDNQDVSLKYASAEGVYWISSVATRGYFVMRFLDRISGEWRGRRRRL